MSDTSQRFRLAAVTSHPVQYQAPLFQRLAQHPSIDLTVYYGHDGSVMGDIDRDFGVPVKWDRPLLDGYSSVTLASGRTWLDAIKRLRIVSLLLSKDYDAVFIHSYGTLLSLATYLGAWLSRTPILLRTESELIRPRHPAVHLFKRALLRSLFRRTTAFLVIGEANRRFYDSFQIPASRLFETPYGVDNEFFRQQRQQLHRSRPQLKRELGLPEDAPTICFSGKLIERKRPFDLLRAYAELVRRGHLSSLLFIGDGPLRGELEDFVSRESLRHVKFAGFCNQTELARHYGACDIFVLPARFETWGLVVNEAMLFELPVAVTEDVGCRFDLVTSGETGEVFKVADVNGLTSILATWITNETERSKIGAQAAARVELYGLDRCVTGIVGALNTVACNSASS